jgi:hypothetical protein
MTAVGTPSINRLPHVRITYRRRETGQWLGYRDERSRHPDELHGRSVARNLKRDVAPAGRNHLCMDIHTNCALCGGLIFFFRGFIEP